MIPPRVGYDRVTSLDLRCQRHFDEVTHTLWQGNQVAGVAVPCI